MYSSWVMISWSNHLLFSTKISYKVRKKTQSISISSKKYTDFWKWRQNPNRTINLAKICPFIWWKTRFVRSYTRQSQKEHLFLFQKLVAVLPKAKRRIGVPVGWNRTQAAPNFTNNLDQIRLSCTCKQWFLPHTESKIKILAPNFQMKQAINGLISQATWQKRHPAITPLGLGR